MASSHKRRLGDSRMGYCDVWGGGCFRIVGAAMLLFGIFAPSYQVSAQPTLLEKIKEAQGRLEGVGLNHQVTTIREAAPVMGRSRGRGRKPTVRYVKLQALTRDVAVTGLNLK